MVSHLADQEQNDCNIYHHWFHTGQAHAIRQMLGHTGMPEFVGDMAGAGYRAEG